MRHRSGLSSDNDRTNETLRKRKNATRERSGNDDLMLLGLIPLQRIQPTSLTARTGNTSVTGDGNFERAGHGAATMMTLMKADSRGSGGGFGQTGLGAAMMMTLIRAGSRGGGGNGSVRRAVKTAIAPTGHATITRMMMLMKNGRLGRRRGLMMASKTSRIVPCRMMMVLKNTFVHVVQRRRPMRVTVYLRSRRSCSNFSPNRFLSAAAVGLGAREAEPPMACPAPHSGRGCTDIARSARRHVGALDSPAPVSVLGIAAARRRRWRQRAPR